jgi:hypothetical protein
MITMSESLKQRKGENPSKDANPSKVVEPPVQNSHIDKWNRAIEEQLRTDPKGKKGVNLSAYKDAIFPNLNPELVKQWQEKRSPINEWNEKLDWQMHWKRQEEHAEET